MLLLLLLGVLSAWILSRRIYKKYWLRGLSVQIEFQDRFIYEEDTSAIKETIINDKFLPLPALEVRFSSGRNLEFLKDAVENTSTTDQCYKCDVFSFLFHQKIERILPFTAHKRGFYQIFDASLFGYDFFFHSGYHMDLPQRSALYVYPRQVDTHRISLLTQAVSGMLLSHSRLYPDPFEFSGIRDYRKEDPMNRINWKASARTGNLMVNQFDSTTNISLTLIFDLEDSLILKYEDLLEETIRITSSLAARLVKNRMPLHVKSNAIDSMTNAPFSLCLSADTGGTAELNRRLACIDSSSVLFPADTLLQREVNENKSEHTYIFISKNKDARLIQSLCTLVGTSNQILWVLPINPADTAIPELPLHSGFKLIPWKV